MAWGRCGVPSRCSSSGSRRRCVAPSPGSCAPRAGVAGTHFAATIAAIHARAGSPVAVPPGDEAAFLASYPSGLLTTDLDVRARLTRFGLREIGAVAELPRSALIARFGEEGAQAPCPGAWRGDRAVPGAPRPGAPGPRPAHRAAGRGPRAVAVRAPPARGRDHGPAHLPGTRRGPRGPDPGAGPGLRRARDVAADRGRAALPGTHRGPRGRRAAAVRAAGTGAAAGRGRAAGPGVAWHDRGGRPATAVVRATGRANGTARLAARAAGPDLRGGPRPAGRDRRTRRRPSPRPAGRGGRSGWKDEARPATPRPAADPGRDPLLASTPRSTSSSMPTGA